MMADKAKGTDQPQDQPQTPAKGEGAVQDLPPTHPNDPTETTLTQDAGPDEDARREAVAKRLGEGA